MPSRSANASSSAGGAGPAQLRRSEPTGKCGCAPDSYPGGVSLRAVVRRSVPRRGWAGAGDVLLVVRVTASQVTGPRSGSPGHVPDLLAGVAGTTLGVAAALAGGEALWWRRSWPVGVLAVCVAGYAVNTAVVPGVPPYAGWVALYAAGVYGGRARRVRRRSRRRIRQALNARGTLLLAYDAMLDVGCSMLESRAAH